ncbi:prepilin-type N-terminal cleavage/methylation domain-containing protein [Neisseriaceae bacterium ESL0693]|nr:prepilin-type N-terminal cleavage/methylation domain-containing protein [Neisseriaceae bacterium ESL0693]
MISNIQNSRNRSPRHQRGLTLIELMVASAIGIVVLLAASSTYFSTFRLKQQVQTRVAYEQDVRNTANMMRRDARQLGNYSCMDAPTAAQLNTGKMTGAFDDNNNTQSISTTLPISFNADNPGLTLDTNSTALVMVSGSEALANSVVATGKDEGAGESKNSCGHAIVGDNTLQGVIYVVATDVSTGKKGLYRILYTNGNTNNLGAPQLLVDNVISVQQQFQYDDLKSTNCPSVPEDDNADVAWENLAWKDPKLTILQNQLDFDKKNPPILITTTLTTCPNGVNDAGTCTANASSSGPVTYVIKSMVRQGAVCAQQALDE